MKSCNKASDLNVIARSGSDEAISNEIATLPSVARNDSKAVDLQVQAHNIFAISELKELLGSFREDNIPVIVLKGASLLEMLYEKDFSRPMCDIDLLVKRADLRRIKERLSQLGYHFLSYNGDNHITYCKKEPPFIPIEIHWELLKRNHPLQRYAFGIETEDFWEDLLPLRINGQKAHTMSCENLIIYLSCHLLKESYADQKWFIDIDKVICHFKREINWKKVIERAEKYKVRIPIWCTLSYIHKFYNTPLPEGLLEEFRPQRFTWWQDRVIKRIFSNQPIKKWHLLLLYLSAIETTPDRIRAVTELGPYLLGNLISSKHFIRNSR